MWDFTSPRKVIFGEDALDYLNEQEFRHAFIITDPIMKKLHLEKIEKRLKDINTKITVFDEISEEPTLQIVFKGAKLLRSVKPDVIIALGGGSVIDTAKGMWPMWADPSTQEDAIEGLSPFAKLDLRKKTGAVLINIPTTSGTGADVTWATVLTDESGNTNRKASFANRELVADVTILDPVLIETLPQHLIAGTAIDALSHAIDAYLSTWNNDFSDALLLHAFKLIWKNLPLAYEKAETGPPPRDILQKLHNSATMAGWGMGNSQIIITHSIAHSLGSVFNLPHSIIVGISCWYSLMFNREVAKTRIADLARIAGCEGENEQELSDNLIKEFKQLLVRLTLPISLNDIGINRQDFDNNMADLIEYALNDSGTLSNPRSVDYSDYEIIFESMFQGKNLTSG
ncbi:MAG: iron-containing alcohol dehydrogenase [Candidatus Hodarchaeales archaeon]|jgi:alcohol dehydrogenase class IV